MISAPSHAGLVLIYPVAYVLSSGLGIRDLVMKDGVHDLRREQATNPCLLANVMDQGCCQSMRGCYGVTKKDAKPSIRGGGHPA